MPPRERRTLLLLLLLAAAGHGARLALLPPGAPPGAVLAGPGGGPPPRTEASARGSRIGPVDLDRAGAAEIAGLPGIGPGLARRIVADRESRGTFGDLAGLDRVRGVGPKLLAELAPHVTFSGPRAAPAPQVLAAPHLSAPAPAGAAALFAAADPAMLERLPGIGPARARAITAWQRERGPIRSAQDLARIPGIGARLAGQVWAAAESGLGGPPPR